MPGRLTAPSSYHRHVVCLLERCAHIGQVKQLQAHVITSGGGQSQFLSFKLLRFCSLVLSDLPHASLIFRSLPAPNVFLYSAMLSSLLSPPAAAGAAAALELFNRLRRLGRPRPNEFVYPLVLRACADRPDPSMLRSIHSHLLKTGFDAYGVVQTSLLDCYARRADLATARLLFDRLPERNVVSWTALITGFVRVGLVGNALLLFEEMPAERDVPSWNAVITGCTQNGLFSEAVELFCRMVVEGVKPNHTTVSCILSACGHLGMLRVGKLVHSYVCRSQLGLTPFVSNSLLDMYGRCGNLKEAQWIFDVSSDRSLIAWNSLINCFALHGHCERAIAAFDNMKLERIEPDEITFVGLLNACTHGGLVQRGLQYFDSMNADYKIEPKIEHYGCIVDLLGRAGRFEDAMNIVKDMKVEPDEVVWGSLLHSCRLHGNMMLAEFAITRLLETDPTNTDYGQMLANLYSQRGMWEEVRKVRKVMKEVGGKKLPGCSWIEVNRKTHQFYSGDKSCRGAEEIYKVLEDLVELMEG
ncbi:pentatricopeptide repeat-containing protein At1g33350 [Ananas comosus]|uniref:Pentatricopeptide repeat-containing protein At1g33350 n=1 Tax=Ananas comosus TaxID=4615 RepID=A0A6P5G1R2_ANACO|nr:pentatricopeptide repeat-containing protein At1g33350 [Ananas comosus]